MSRDRTGGTRDSESMYSKGYPRKGLRGFERDQSARVAGGSDGESAPDSRKYKEWDPTRDSSSFDTEQTSRVLRGEDRVVHTSHFQQFNNLLRIGWDSNGVYNSTVPFFCALPYSLRYLGWGCLSL